MKRFYIAEMLGAYPAHRFRIIEKVHTIDGPRDRITNAAFATLTEAEEYVNANA
jgi:hypothetical protein